MKPLAVVQEHIQNIDIESNNALIPYSGQDEIGALINGYNKMVVKLDESMKRFAILEREAAWRDMARQVAHEIKKSAYSVETQDTTHSNEPYRCEPKDEGIF